jgi:hypothetical protein
LRSPEVGHVGLLPSYAQLYMFVQCLSSLDSLLFNTIGSSPASSVPKKSILSIYILNRLIYEKHTQREWPAPDC